MDTKKTILFVDDYDLVRESLSSLLIDDGYHVITASDGLEATNKFLENENDISIIILDIDMPHKNGIQVYQEISEKNKDVIFILIPGNGIYEKELMAISKNENIRLLKKPFVYDSLKKLVDDLLVKNFTN